MTILVPAPIHSTPKRMVHGSHSDDTFVYTSSLDQQAVQGLLKLGKKGIVDDGEICCCPNRLLGCS